VGVVVGVGWGCVERGGGMGGCFGGLVVLGGGGGGLLWEWGVLWCYWCGGWVFGVGWVGV
jgi:hypothetical protein